MKKLLLLLSLVTAVTVNANQKFELALADGTLVDMGTIDSTLSNYKRGFDGTIRFQNSSNFKLDATILKLNFDQSIYEGYTNEWGYITPGKVLDITYGK